jgi:hypothetical protein
MNKYRGMYLHTQCVTGGGIGLCGEHLQESYTVYLTRFRTYKIALPPQTKTEEVRGPQTDEHLPPGPLQVNFEEKPTFRIGY